MKAKVGDWIRILGHHAGDPDRRGQVVGVRSEDGSPPFEVQWLGSEHVTIFYPGSDAVIEEPHAVGQ